MVGNLESVVFSLRDCAKELKLNGFSQLAFEGEILALKVEIERLKITRDS